MFYWFAKRYTTLTLKEIGAMVGNIDHSTVIHGLTIVEQYISQDKQFARDMKRHDDFIVSRFINPQTDSVESINAEIEQLKEKLNRVLVLQK